MQKIRNFSLDQAVRATAGAGKTTGLISAVESCYKSHLNKTGNLPYILLTTFTIKAANELSERLLDYALKKNDEQFLSYVSSHFLEIGTMHSTFMKVLGAISQSENEEDLHSFQSIKYFHAKKYLHKVIKEQASEELFDFIGDDKFLAKLFIELFEAGHLNFKLTQAENILQNLVSNISGVINSGPEEFLFSIKKNFEKIEQTDLSQNESSFFNLLGDFKNFIESKIAQKCKREEKSYYRALLKTLKVPEAEESYFRDYIRTHKALFNCFNEWKLEYEKALESDLGYGISDIEWRLFNQLLIMEDEIDLWDYCFFDEYQDTSPIQKKVIENLTPNTPCYFVGDPFQSIYYFRGARKDIFLNDFARVKSDGGKAEFRLDNYRSAPQIVDFVNLICEAKLEGFKPMQSRKDVEGSVEVFYNEEACLDDELRFIYSKLNQVDLSKESFAILGRNAKELMICAKFLKSKGISASTSLSKSFESSLEVVDLCNVLTFIHYPHDNSNFISLMRSPWFDIDDQEISGLLTKLSAGDSPSLWNLFKENHGVSLFHTLLEEFRSLNSNEVLVNFIVYSNFLSITESLDSTGKREQNIWKLIGILQREEDSQNFDVRAFTQDILGGAYPLEKDSSEPETGCVLMTVHASKGLQFDHVAILAANKSFSSRSGSLIIDEEKSLFSFKVYNKLSKKKVLPDFFESSVLKDKNEIAQESRRLFYVAMTRAVKKLYVSGVGAISKTPFEPSWMKIILDFQESNTFNLLSEFDLEVVVEEKAATTMKGFVINSKRKEREYDDEATSVTASIASSKEAIGAINKTTAISELSNNIVKGTLFHEFVERSCANENIISKVNNFFIDDVESNHRAFDYLSKQKDFPFNKLMDVGEKEWGFDYVDDEAKFFSGKIDLWGIENSTVWIVDFKTGQAKYREKGFTQLEFYTDVLKRVLNNPSLKFKLVLTFPFIEETEVREA